MRATTMHSYAKWLLGGALALVAAGAFAGEITLFAQPGFQGRYLDTQDALPNLPRAGFDDYASSIMIATGTWEACSETYYRGRCVRLSPGRYYNVSETLDQPVASVREIADVPTTSVVVAEAAPAPVVIAPAPDARIVLIAHSPRGDRSMELTSTIRDLDRADFDRRADAAIVYGGVWQLCDEPRGRGECTEVGPGRYDTLGALDRRVSSVELVVPATNTLGPAPTLPRVVLYEGRDFGGRSIALEGSEARDLERLNFDDRVASMRVESGRWLLCSRANFEGQCRTFGPGEYPRLGSDLDRRVASARPVADVRLGALTYR